MTVLKRVDGGGHRATPKWTRHCLLQDSDTTVCGLYVNVHSKTGNVIKDGLGVQGDINNCKRCFHKKKRRKAKPKRRRMFVQGGLPS